MEDIRWLEVERIRGCEWEEHRTQNAVWETEFGSPSVEPSPKLAVNEMLANRLPDSDWRLWSHANSTFIAGIVLSPALIPCKANCACTVPA
jgi:hypothetical protein